MNTTTKAVIFKNFSDEDFTWTWDGVPYDFKAGQEMYMEDWKAQHFAKHLVNRELNKLGRLTNDASRSSFIKRCLPTSEALTAQSDEQMKTVLMNTPDPGSDKMNSDAGIAPKKKAGRPKKLPEAQFEGLKTA